MSGIFLIFCAAFLWAVDTLIRYPLIFEGVSAEKIVFFEHLFLCLAMAPVIKASWPKLKRASKKDWLALLVIGGLGSAWSTLFFTKAFFLINPSLVILLQKFQPIIAVVLAKFLLNEPLGKRFVLWSIPCIVGGFLISYKDIFPGLISIDGVDRLISTDALSAYGFTMLAVIGWGSSTVFGKKLSERYSEREIMSGRFSVGLIFTIPLLGGQIDILETSWGFTGKVGGMVLISGILAMALYYQGLKRIPARLAALGEMFFPLCAIFLNWLVLDKSLTIVQLVGGALLLTGASVIQVKRY